MQTLQIPGEQNPYNFPTPAPGEILPVPMASFEAMAEDEECDPWEIQETEGQQVTDDNESL